MSARFSSAAVVVGRRGGTVCAYALLLAAVFLCAFRWSRPFLDEGWRKAGCLTFLAAALCTSGRLSLAAHEVPDCARTVRCGSVVLSALRPISKPKRRCGLQQFCRLCRRTLGFGDDHVL